MLNILAGMPQNETTFEYLAGCWKRLNLAVRDTGRHVSLYRKSATLIKGSRCRREESMDGSRG
jgi:ubiquitin conjugation factor E4 B